ncbi:probable protein phosphatase 2C 12 isoform X2 [Aristolochia californica]|uniref:probable protein phosphatase 2C 12 isoform X2 n=1 Tax=Aristolochia californica TaxID=171875 RepID=UPI0035DF9D48
MSSKNGMVPLAVLLKRELTNEKIENPDILHGQANQSKKGEDFTLSKTECQRVPGDGSTTFSVFGLFDGHNGSAAAIYTKENLLNNVLSAIPSDLSRDEWLAALPRALVAGFIKTDKDFQDHAQTSGTTVTFMIIDGWVVTVASVGDSQCILESAEGAIYYLSADHRLDENEQEVQRVTASGGEVGKLNTGGGTEIGPLRCWPGGLCLSRSIGDMDVGEFIVPIPYVKQVKEAVQVKGLRDDTTCIVIDMLPPEKLAPPLQAQKKPGKGVFKAMFKKRCSESSSSDRDFCEPDVVEEMFEDGSAVLAERLDMEYPLCNIFKLFKCAVCQLEMKPGEGISVHEGSSSQGRLRPWDGPFLCKSCQLKKEAMEGRRRHWDGNGSD